MKKNVLTTIILALLLINISCSSENEMNDSNEPSQKAYPEIVEKLEELQFNADELELVNLKLPDGTEMEVFEFEDDIVMSREQIEEMQFVGYDTSSKQYRSSNLVNTWGGVRTLRIVGWNAGANGLNARERTALTWAVHNYNSLNLNIRLSLSWGTNANGKDIVMFNDSSVTGKSGGKSGFPWRGNPYKWVRIYGIHNHPTNTIEAVMTHEIGHAIGMRHSDWWSRQSCNRGVRREYTGIHIPGTTSGYDYTSIYNACVRSNTNGEINHNDRIALRYLY
ncbi:MAG: M57 family metalloprotease [Flavobacteriaceae bacterium]